MAAAAHEQSIAEAMISDPKTHSVEISLADAIDAFTDTHIHMLLLTRDGILHGTLVRDDLPPGLDPRRPAVSLATIVERTICPTRSLDEATQRLNRSMARRLAVTNADRSLVGLLCLKRTRLGFCTEADVLARRDGESPMLSPTADPRHLTSTGAR
jgi:CBS domain-containing protein